MKQENEQYVVHFRKPSQLLIRVCQCAMFHWFCYRTSVVVGVAVVVVVVIFFWWWMYQHSIDCVWYNHEFLTSAPWIHAPNGNKSSTKLPEMAHLFISDNDHFIYVFVYVYVYIYRVDIQDRWWWWQRWW